MEMDYFQELQAEADRYKHLYEIFKDRADKAEKALAGALANLADASRARGEAEGRLAASEMAGIVEGWKARAEKAEAEAKKLREALKPFAKAGELFPDPPPVFEQCIYRPAAGDEYQLSGKDLRRARAALNQGGDDGARDRAREEGEK